jgi:hypothetical protein
MKKTAVILAGAMTFVPLFAFAQLGNVENIVESIGNLVSLATPIVVGLALLAFFWGLVKFIFSAGDEEARKGAKSLMIWSVIALFVMISIVGIINFIGNALDINQGGSLDVPEVQGI